MGALSQAADALNHAINYNSFTRGVVEVGSNAAQNTLAPGVPVAAEAIVGAAIPAMYKALQNNPNAPFSPSAKSRVKAGVNVFKKGLPKSTALAIIGNAIFESAEALYNGYKQKEEEERQRRELLEQTKDFAPGIGPLRGWPFGY